MATMKRTSYLKNSQIRYLALFSIACLASSLADVQGLGLILIGIWMQVANVLHLQGRPLTKNSQLFYLKYFVACIPLILIYGSVNAFFPLFWKNFEIIKLLSINIVQWICAFLICLFMVLNFSLQHEQQTVSSTIVKVLANLKNNLIGLLHLTFIFWGLNLVLLLLNSNEYFLVLSYAIIHLYWIQWTQKKPVVVSPE